MIVVVKNCDVCPFALPQPGQECEGGPQVCQTCALSTPKFRSLFEFPKRPEWCKLRREQVIVREFQ